MLFSLALAAVVCLGLTGCGERVNKQTEVQTEAKTEAPVIEVQTETQKITETEKQTETEPPTEAVTEAVTEAPVPKDLTPEEEAQAEKNMEAATVYYAKDDINVRSTPSTENSENIISSFDQGEEVTVIGETPNWFKVQKDDFEGYVSKEFLSETTVDPKSPEERSAAADAEAANAAAAQPEGTSGYAESYPIKLSGDANLRAEATETSDVIDTIAAGTQVTAIGEAGEWYQVDYNGTVGYVHKNLVS